MIPDILKCIFSFLRHLYDIKSARLVCRDWAALLPFSKESFESMTDQGRSYSLDIVSIEEMMVYRTWTYLSDGEEKPNFGTPNASVRYAPLSARSEKDGLLHVNRRWITELKGEIDILIRIARVSSSKVHLLDLKAANGKRIGDMIFDTPLEHPILLQPSYHMPGASFIGSEGDEGFDTIRPFIPALVVGEYDEMYCLRSDFIFEKKDMCAMTIDPSLRKLFVNEEPWFKGPMFEEMLANPDEYALDSLLRGVRLNATIANL